jgi:hypothetical protein
MKNMLIVCALFCAQVQSTGIKIASPLSLTKAMGSKGEVQSHLGNKGHINYGTSFMGRLYYPISNREGCSAFFDTDFKEDTDSIGNFDKSGSSSIEAEPILLLDHGSCTHVHKTKMA